MTGRKGAELLKIFELNFSNNINFVTCLNVDKHLREMSEPIGKAGASAKNDLAARNTYRFLLFWDQNQPRWVLSR